MLEVRQKDVGTLLQVKSLDPDQTLGDGGDEVPAEAHHAAEIQTDQEPSHQGWIKFTARKVEIIFEQKWTDKTEATIKVTLSV